MRHKMTLAFIAVTGLFFGFFCLTSKAQERLEAIQNGTVTGKYENSFGKYITVNDITFHVSHDVYAQLSIGMTLPLQQ